MLTLWTGLPGHGKTLTCIDHIQKEFPKRDVYVSGIPELLLPWIPLEDPDKWYECPEGAVIIIDESQRVFPVRSPKTEVPKKCSEFETHRHKGYDLFLITQDARLLDHHVRRLAGCHVHVRRMFGLERCVRYQWEKASNPEDYHEKKQAIVTHINYPKKLYGQYKSATIHTVKKKLPKKLLLLPVGLLVLIGLGILFINTLFGKDAPIEGPASAAIQEAVNKKTGVGRVVESATPNRTMTTTDYVNYHSPRIPDIPMSAPIYDDVYRARTMPRPQCMAGKFTDGSTCRCYSQQATWMDIGPEMCKQIVKKGWFDPTREDQRFSGSYERRYYDVKNRTSNNQNARDQAARAPRARDDLQNY